MVRSQETPCIAWSLLPVSAGRRRAGGRAKATFCWMLVGAALGWLLLGFTPRERAQGAEREGNETTPDVVLEAHDAGDEAGSHSAPEASPRRPLLERIGPQRRAKVLSALAALVILGLAMIFLAWLGARATRRYMNREPILRQKPPSGTPIRETDWADKPLGSPFEEEEE